MTRGLSVIQFSGHVIKSQDYFVLIDQPKTSVFVITTNASRLPTSTVILDF